MATRKELTATAMERYRISDREEKARILDEFVNITGIVASTRCDCCAAALERTRVNGSVVEFITRRNAVRSSYTNGRNE